MTEKKSLVEEALIQMKSLENVVAENAKGILASTMKEEIGQLVKESLLTEQPVSGQTSNKSSMEEADDDEIEDTEIEDTDDEETTDDEESMDDEESDEISFTDDDDSEDMLDMDMSDDDEEPIDLTNASDEEILKVFKGMGEQDGIIVKKEGDTIDLKDNENEYKIRIGESDDDEFMDMMGDEDMVDMDTDDSDMMDDDTEDYSDLMSDESDEEDWEEIGSDTHHHGHETDEMSHNDDDEIVFEIEMDDYKDEDESYEEMGESWSEEEDEKLEESFKAKGVGMGKPKFQYKKSKGGFKETMKQGTKGVGMGKPKFEFKEGMKSIKPKGMGIGKPKFEYKETTGKPTKVPMKKSETKEASRTLGSGRKFGRHGLPKPKAAPRHLEVESVNNELAMLRAKNEEYRKALNVFRDKLNEVAIFNSNLAYATRLFTEHSTTKQEKINILRRFDSAETLKESKTLYKTMKDELSSQNGAKVVKESIQEKIERTPSSGSAANLIESKTYENPQFMRMKDLMSKMNIIK